MWTDLRNFRIRFSSVPVYKDDVGIYHIYILYINNVKYLNNKI